MLAICSSKLLKYLCSTNTRGIKWGDKITEAAVRDLNRNHAGIDHNIVATQDPEGHVVDNSRAFLPLAGQGERALASWLWKWVVAGQGDGTAWLFGEMGSGSPT